MEKQDSLKIDGNYDPTSRFRFIDAVEGASERMASMLRDYVGFHERGPENVVVRCRRYSPFLCISRLQREINALGLTSAISFSSNGSSSNGNLRDLIFDLDSMADECFVNVDYDSGLYG